VGPRNHVLDGGPDPPLEGTILADRGTHYKVWGLSAVSCAKTAEPINLPFGLWTRVGRRRKNSMVFARCCQCALIGRHVAARGIATAGDTGDASPVRPTMSPLHQNDNRQFVLGADF